MCDGAPLWRAVVVCAQVALLGLSLRAAACYKPADPPP
jgi:hypothetical protein